MSMVTGRPEGDQSANRTRALYHDPERIIWRRYAAGLDQQSLARKAGISKTHMWQIEHAKRSASPEILGKIAAALECDPSDLMRPEPARRAS